MNVSLKTIFKDDLIKFRYAFLGFIPNNIHAKKYAGFSHSSFFYKHIAFKWVSESVRNHLATQL